MARAACVSTGVAVLALGVATGACTAGPLLWITDINGNIGIVDVPSGAVTSIIGHTGTTLTDIAFDAAGNLWGIDFTSLYSVDRTTAALTLVGSTGVPTGNALVFGPDGTLYAAGGGSTLLYSLNLTTGHGTSLGNIGFGSAGDLAFNGGSLYMPSSTNLIRISLGPVVSGAIVGSMGFSNVFGLATGDNGVLYGVAGTRVFSVNTTTGAGTLVSDYAFQGLVGANGTAFLTEAPSPGSAAALAMWGCVALRRRRTRVT